MERRLSEIPGLFAYVQTGLYLQPVVFHIAQFKTSFERRESNRKSNYLKSLINQNLYFYIYPQESVYDSFSTPIPQEINLSLYRKHQGTSSGCVYLRRQYRFSHRPILLTYSVVTKPRQASVISRLLASIMSISSSGVRVSTTGFLFGLTALRS